MNNTQTNAIEYHIRTPRLAEAPEILSIFAAEVEAGRMLPRSEENIRAGLQNWRVATKFSNDSRMAFKPMSAKGAVVFPVANASVWPWLEHW